MNPRPIGSPVDGSHVSSQQVIPGRIHLGAQALGFGGGLERPSCLRRVAMDALLGGLSLLETLQPAYWLGGIPASWRTDRVKLPRWRKMSHSFPRQAASEPPWGDSHSAMALAERETGLQVLKEMLGGGGEAEERRHTVSSAGGGPVACFGGLVLVARR